MVSRNRNIAPDRALLLSPERNRVTFSPVDSNTPVDIKRRVPATRAVIPEVKTVSLPGQKMERVTYKPVENAIVVPEKQVNKTSVRATSPDRDKAAKAKRIVIGEGDIDPIFNILRPLESTMKKALAEKGEPVPKRIDVLAQQFYNKIVRKNQPNNFSGQNVLPEIFLFDYDSIDAAGQAVIDSIMNYYNTVQAKAQNNPELLTPTEQTIVSGLSVSNSKGIGLGGTTIWIIGGAIALILVIVLLRK